MRPHTDPSDESLVARAERGDREAVALLVRRHSPRLYGFIRRYHPDRDDCDDLLQETWIRVVSSLDRFDPRKSFSTWIFQIAVNLCRDLARRERTRSAFRNSVRETRNGFTGMTAERKAESMRAMQAIERLPIEQKEVLLLRYYHGLAEAEVAEIVGCPRGTVKSRLHQAVKAVRGSLRVKPGGD